jgi:uroporphyrinogen-III synthase
LENQNLEGKRFLLPCSSIANPQLADGLKAKGAVVDSLVVYETIPQSKTESAPKIKKMQKNIFDYFLFTSPSAYESFLYLVGIQSPREYFGEAKIIAIGKTTRAAIKGSGIENVSIPSAATFENMLTMIPFTI